MKLKVWDNVQAITWSNKWQQWVVLKVISRKIEKKWDKVLVDWMNMKTKYTKKTNEKPWSMIKKEFPLESSNVAIICPKTNKPSRVWYVKWKDWKKIRIAKSSWEKIDKAFKKS